MILVLQIACFMLPWALRRILLQLILKTNIPKSSYIGISLIGAQMFEIGAYSRIGHLNVVRRLKSLRLGEKSSVGNLNWISGHHVVGSAHFTHLANRVSALAIGRESSITNRHLIDCTDTVSIGDFSTLAGFRSQLLTHAIDLQMARQDASPIAIGDYCFIGTSVVILMGSEIPNFSVIAPGALVRTKLRDEFCMYGGVPAVQIKSLARDLGYFTRRSGFIN